MTNEIVKIGSVEIGGIEFDLFDNHGRYFFQCQNVYKSISEKQTGYSYIYVCQKLKKVVDEGHRRKFEVNGVYSWYVDVMGFIQFVNSMKVGKACLVKEYLIRCCANSLEGILYERKA